jgi:hypothetical protein
MALPVALLGTACAKVTTHYPDFDGGLNAGGGSSGVSGAEGGYETSVSLGGGAPTGGSRATGGVAATNPATGGSTANTGGDTSAAGGAPATGGAPVIVDAGPTCPAGSSFCDDFEAYAVGGPASQWTARSGSWSVTTDSTQAAGDQQVYTNASTSNASSTAGTGTYADATIEARIRVTAFSSTSASNAAGIYLRSNGSNDYDFALGGDGQVYLRRDPTSSTAETCTGETSASSGVAVLAAGCPSSKPCTGWFKLKLTVSGTVAAGVTITGYVDPTGTSGYTQVLQCVQNTGSQYMYDSGSAGVFAKGSAPANYDDVAISVQ